MQGQQYSIPRYIGEYTGSKWRQTAGECQSCKGETEILQAIGRKTVQAVRCTVCTWNEWRVPRGRTT